MGLNRHQRRALKSRSLKLAKGNEMPKTIEEVQADYTRLCAQLGQSVLQVLAGAQEIQQRVGALNKEHQELQAIEKAKQEKVTNVETKKEIETVGVGANATGGQVSG